MDYGQEKYFMNLMKVLDALHAEEKLHLFGSLLY